MTEQQWGRVRIDAECPLRRGAWYRVTRLTSNEAVVDVNHNGVSVPARPCKSCRDRISTGPSCHGPATRGGCPRAGGAVRRLPELLRASAARQAGGDHALPALQWRV